MERKIRVLCVDDDAATRTLYRLIVGAEPDMECVAALSSAATLVEAVAANRPDVVLLDLRMPGPDPMEELRHTSRAHPQARVVVFSGLDDAESVEQALSSGAAAYLSKDTPPEEMLATIRRLAGKP
jgi:DNA-binding NarL/FixJ family response regulator